jgi:TetR/AcrR family transcriptional regulator, cholesterol catabolism regulator
VTETRRLQIDDAASALFREHGYAATSVRQIARALDLQGASLYAHVASKEDVLWSIVDRTASRFEHAAETSDEPSMLPAERLARLVRAHVRVITEQPGAATVFVHEWRGLNGDRRAAVLARRDRYERRWRMLIEEGAASGAFARVDAAAAAAFLLAALNGVAAWYRPDGRLSAGSLADSYVDLALRSLTAGPSAPEETR